MAKDRRPPAPSVSEPQPPEAPPPAPAPPESAAPSAPPAAPTATPPAAAPAASKGAYTVSFLDAKGNVMAQSGVTADSPEAAVKAVRPSVAAAGSAFAKLIATYVVRGPAGEKRIKA